MSRRDALGQVTIEFLLIVGLVVALAIPALNYLYPGVQSVLRHAVGCIISDECD